MFTEYIKQTNRDQANEFPGHIKFLGLKKGAKSAVVNPIAQLTDERIEALAEHINHIWVKSKYDDGWMYSGTRNDEKKRHNLLVGYDELDESEKEKDRTIAREILPLLDKAGMGVYRTIETDFCLYY